MQTHVSKMKKIQEIMTITTKDFIQVVGNIKSFLPFNRLA